MMRQERPTDDFLFSGRDSCGGDSGGPLMGYDGDVENDPHYLIGIVSFGTGVCGIVSVKIQKDLIPEEVLSLLMFLGCSWRLHSSRILHGLDQRKPEALNCIYV